MLAVGYDPRAVRARFLGVQVLPVVVGGYCWAAFGGLVQIKSLPLLVTSASLIMAIYVVLMFLLVRALKDPVVLAIQGRRLRWRPAFTTINRILAEGSCVSMTDQEVLVEPPLERTPTTSLRDGATVFKLPGGIARPTPRRFQVD